MRYLSKFKLFENSSFPTDPAKVQEICNKYNIYAHTINSDGSVDIHGDVNLEFKDLERLPLKFGIVRGYFCCGSNRLSTLEGAPHFVSQTFDCQNNNLTSLIGAPREVGGTFDCDGNEITSLEGAPIKVARHFYCNHNKLTTLEGCPSEISGSFGCGHNPLTSLKGAPKEVGGSFGAISCKIITLEDMPTDVDEFYLSGNPVFEIVKIFEDDKTLLLQSLKYNYFAGGNKIRESRFLEACDDLGVTAPDHIEGYVWV